MLRKVNTSCRTQVEPCESSRDEWFCLVDGAGSRPHGESYPQWTLQPPSESIMFRQWYNGRQARHTGSGWECTTFISCLDGYLVRSLLCLLLEDSQGVQRTGRGEAGEVRETCRGSAGGAGEELAQRRGGHPREHPSLRELRGMAPFCSQWDVLVARVLKPGRHHTSIKHVNRPMVCRQR